MSRRHIELVVIGVLTIAIILYAGTSIVYGGALAGNAERTLNTVVSHQNTLNTAFNQIDSEVTALNGSGTFNPQQEVGLVDRSIANSQLALKLLDRDDSALTVVERDLNGTRWLTAVGHNSVDRESARITHAHNALAAARTIASDEVLDGQFWHSLYSSLADLDKLNGQATGGDLAAAKATLASMKTDVDQAVQLSTAPGLPVDLHNLVVDLQAFVGDYGKQLDAQIAGDDATVAALKGALDSDRAQLSTYDIDRIGKAIDAFYKPLIDRYNSEIAAATS